MRGKNWVCVLVLFFLFTKCSEERVPVGLYDYQVMRLLAAEDQKVWLKSQDILSCTDSIFLVFDLIEGTPDSLDLFEISYDNSCVSDTSYLGRCRPSSFIAGDLFTDSLKFANDNFWMVENVTSKLLILRIQDRNQRYFFE